MQEIEEKAFLSLKKVVKLLHGKEKKVKTLKAD